MQLDVVSLKKWFLSEKRELPWRIEPGPYAVWVSEVMLQQTQVAVVIPYFERWMKQFPTIEALAKAPISEVIKAWEGLGYYSRARNLHEGALYVLEHHDGKLPNTEEELLKIKGLGHYTVGAILSFAFRKRAAAVDGNVMRVLSRYLLIREDISKNKTVQELRQVALSILPEEESWVVNEALIELGATICSKKPKCAKCPLKLTCKGYLQGASASLPIKSAKIKTEFLYRAVAVIFSEGSVLLRKGKTGEIMQDLYEFPYFDTTTEGPLVNDYEKNWNDLLHESTLEPISQSFTRYRVKLFPSVFSAKKKQDIEDGLWVPLDHLSRLPFSSGHRKIMTKLLKDQG